MSYRRRSLLPIGIHFSSEAVYMAQLEQSEGQVSVVSKAAKRLASALTMADRIQGGGQDVTTDTRQAEAMQFVREKVTMNGFRGTEAVISLPPEHLVIQHVRLAPMQPDELASGLIVELQGKLPFDPRQAVIRHIVAGTISDNNEMKQDVIVLAARRAVVEKHVAAVNRLGLTVVGVGVEPCAMCYPYMLAASHAPAPPEGPPAMMIVYLGSRTTHVAIVRGADMTFVKGVEIGTDNLVEALASARRLTAPEAAALRTRWCESPVPSAIQEAVEAYNGIRSNLEHISDEIESCMRYHASLARGSRIDQVLFLGPEARDRALVRVIGAHVGVACEIGNPVASITGMSGECEPEMAVALGLGLFTAQ